MNVKTFVKKMLKACIPYGILRVRRYLIENNNRRDSVTDIEKMPQLRARLRMERDEEFFCKSFLKQLDDGSTYFDFNGAYLPDIRNTPEFQDIITFGCMEDTFLIHCLFNNNYDRKIVEKLDLFMDEGPYGYTDGDFDVTIKEDDVVIDAGAWIGDFSAYSVSRGGGGMCYAFEPTKKTFDILKETARLNSRIIPVQTALGACEAEGTVFFAPHHSGGNTTLEGVFNSVLSEKIKIDSLDNFVEKNNIEKIDFIKADIEGAERDMLLGAAKTLKKFQPKLAICTYHLPDDPEILEKTILKINPNYRIRHLRKKLFACVCGR